MTDNWKNDGSTPHPNPEMLMDESTWKQFREEGGEYANAGMSEEDALAAIADPAQDAVPIGDDDHGRT